MIQGSSLSFDYADYDGSGLQDMQFEIAQGELVVLTGLSGCGKSTLLKCLNGLIPHHYEGVLRGDVLLDGQEVRALPIPEISKKVGSVFQDARGQFFTTDVYSELAFSLENHGYEPSAIRKKIDELVCLFNLEMLTERNIFALSSGERQRLGIACSLSLDPKILLFDEPSANLDYTTTLKLRELLKSLKARGFTIIVADHRVFYLDGLFDSLIYVEDGCIKGQYSPDELRASQGIALREFDVFGHRLLNLKGTLGESRLRAESLSYRDILHDVNLSVRQGEILALVGKNGVGKTTLGKLLCGIEKPDSGKVLSPGATLFIMQDVDYQLFGYSLSNELSLGNKQVTKEAVEEALDKVGLLAWKDSHPFALSGGQKQRLSIALAMVSDAACVIFDEPTSGLDIINMKRVASLVKDIARKKIVLVISHDFEFIARTCTGVAHMENGTVKEQFDFREGDESKLRALFEKMEE